MEIPAKLEQLLLTNKLLHASVQACLGAFEPWIQNRNLPFFSEYTDHGADHIQDVFQTAEMLIRDEAWEVFTPMDAATLLLAILLHDSAMHLTPDSFVALITRLSPEYHISAIDEQAWDQLWRDYLTEATRFDARKLIALFGDTDPVVIPQLDHDKMTGRDRKLIGDFLRRHHARLAHEIALFGVPGPGDNRIRLSSSVPHDLADFAGLVARSHGCPIRSSMEYLESKNALREYKGIHAVFLMALLRIADYLQIQPERAPHQILKVIKLRSPISKGEWNFHHAIETIEHHDDPESLFVIAHPTDIRTFIKIKDLLHDLQGELDTCWAVLGEVYAPFQARNLNKLGLLIRRIRSNLDDVEQFAKRVRYVPTRASFTTADPRVLSLLVAPLYSRDCAFGIRELIQNSVDAVRELREYQKNHAQYEDVPLTPLPADVFICLKEDPETSELWLTVSDRGIGMTPTIICDYFLRAGASFRESDTWRKEFTDQRVKPRVLRAGRFGIGVLAAFLIGPEIQVSTRHVTALPNQAIEFTATLDTDIIELKRISRGVGTEIRIKVFDSLKQKYTKEKWQSAMQWYYLSDPCLQIDIDGEEVKAKYELPAPTGQSLPLYWRDTKHPDFHAILWSYVNAPALSCNGLRVMATKPAEAIELSPGHPNAGSIRVPNISVFDYDGKLPLNLQRTGLTENIPFEKQLLVDVLRDFLAYALVYAPCLCMADTSTWDFYQHVAHPGVEIPVRLLVPWFCTEKGVSFLDSWHIARTAAPSAVAFSLNSQNELLQSLAPAGPMPIIGLQWPPIQRYFQDPFSPEAALYSLLLRRPDASLRRIPATRGVRILLSTALFRSLGEVLTSSLSTKGQDKGILQKTGILRQFIARFPSQLHRDPATDLEKGDWCLMALGDCPAPSKYLENVSGNLPAICRNPQSSILAEWYFSTAETSTELSPVSKAWNEIIRDPVIPYSPEERREKLGHAFEELAPYIQAHQEEQKLTTKAQK